MLKKYTWIVFIIWFLIIINQQDSKMETNDELLIATNEFDYDTDIIQDAISSINRQTFVIQDTLSHLSGRTEINKLKNTLSYIQINVQYSGSISIDECYYETASSVLEKRRGDCVSKSRLAVALLRGQGIQSRTVSGCISEMPICFPILAVTPVSYEIPPRIKDITDIKKRGFLHEWIEVIADGKTYSVDPTYNAIFLKNCDSYNIHSYDDNQYDRCVISDNAFVSECYDW